MIQSTILSMLGKVALLGTRVYHHGGSFVSLLVHGIAVCVYLVYWKMYYSNSNLCCFVTNVSFFDGLLTNLMGAFYVQFLASVREGLQDDLRMKISFVTLESKF